MAKPVEVNDKNFDQVVTNAEIPVLVDFWAPWCGPCRMVAPIVEELAEEFSGKVSFAKLNVDASSAYARKFGITSIPTLMLFKKGKPVEQVVGARSKKELRDIINTSLAEKPAESGKK